jgi:hypothetical protein
VRERQTDRETERQREEKRETQTRTEQTERERGRERGAGWRGGPGDRDGDRERQTLREDMKGTERETQTRETVRSTDSFSRKLSRGKIWMSCTPLLHCYFPQVAGKKTAPRKSRNPSLKVGISKLSRSASYHKRGLAFIKKKNGAWGFGGRNHRDSKALDLLVEACRNVANCQSQISICRSRAVSRFSHSRDLL